MRTLNHVQLIGFLGEDPKIYSTALGMPIARISIATYYSSKDHVNKKVISSTDWHSVVLLGRTAEKANFHMKKGSYVYVEGHIKTQDSEDSNKKIRRTSFILGRDVIVLSNAKEPPVLADLELKEKLHKLRGANEADHECI